MYLRTRKQDSHCLQIYIYSKTCLKLPFQKMTKLFFKTDHHLMQVKSIAECSKGSFLQYFRPSLSYDLSSRFLFCLFLVWPLKTGFTVYWTVKPVLSSYSKKILKYVLKTDYRLTQVKRISECSALLWICAKLPLVFTGFIQAKLCKFKNFSMNFKGHSYCFQRLKT